MSPLSASAHMTHVIRTAPQSPLQPEAAASDYYGGDEHEWGATKKEKEVIT